MQRAVILMAALIATLVAAETPAQHAQAKLDKLSNTQTKPREVVEFPPSEINAWATARIPEVVPQGLRNAHVELGQGSMAATAQVDFLKMRQAKGVPTNRLVAMMIEGERPLKVSVRVESSNSRCTVYLTKVELSGVVLEGAVLDFLIQSFFKPLYPDAKINQPFDLDYNIDRIEVRPQSIQAIIK